jgi:2-desacetyl-2-hydroxyethyl bacteriochlorophyllide A dehydrogenase
MVETARSLRARAFWTVGPGLGEIREETLRAPGPDEVLVEASYSGISRGTESLVFAGRVPPSEHERMRAPHQVGAFPFPVKYGYQSVGRVVDGPAALVGRAVFCLYPHQSRYVVPASDVVVIPDEVPPARAVLAANLETAVNGLWDAAPRIGDRVAVVGGGVVGTLVAYLAARVPGCDVQLIDLQPARAQVAAALGVAFSTPEGARPEADVVLHASGAPEGLVTALSLAGQEATIVELSWYGDRPVSLPLGGAFHARRLTIRSSQVGGLAATQRARWTLRRRLALALSLLADPALDVLIDGESAFDELPSVLPRLALPGSALCHRLHFNESLEA